MYFQALMVLVLIFFLGGCGLKTPNDANGTNSSSNALLNNYSTKTTISGSTATAVKPVGGFVSSVVDVGGGFVTTTARGSFITATALTVPSGTAVTFDTLTDTVSSLLIGRLLRTNTQTALVNSVVSLQ